MKRCNYPWCSETRDTEDWPVPCNECKSVEEQLADAVLSNPEAVDQCLSTPVAEHQKRTPMIIKEWDDAMLYGVTDQMVETAQQIHRGETDG